MQQAINKFPETERTLENVSFSQLFPGELFLRMAQYAASVASAPPWEWPVHVSVVMLHVRGESGAVCKG